jgi:hypothetical protein
MHKLTRSSGLLRLALTGLFWLSIVFQLSSPAARGDAYCAVTLNVTGFDGKPITSTWVELVDPSGRVVHKEMMVGPQLKVCDFGFGPHELRVGTNECLPVTVSNLRLVIGSPVVLNVVLNACGYQETMRTGCLVYFRVVDEGGGTVSSAEFSPRLGQPPRTDSLGRYQGLFTGSHDLTFTASGFEAASAHIECQGREEVDQIVVMKHRPARSQ